jgi:hypothetical protein
MSFLVWQGDDVTETMLGFRIVKSFGRLFAPIDCSIGYSFETVNHFVGLDCLNESDQ